VLAANEVVALSKGLARAGSQPAQPALTWAGEVATDPAVAGVEGRLKNAWIRLSQNKGARLRITSYPRQTSDEKERDAKCAIFQSEASRSTANTAADHPTRCSRPSYPGARGRLSTPSAPPVTVLLLP